MASKKKNKTEKHWYLYTPDGTQFEITGEDGKYYYSGDTQFFKRHGYRTEIVEFPVVEPNETEEPEE